MILLRFSNDYLHQKIGIMISSNCYIKKKIIPINTIVFLSLLSLKKKIYTTMVSLKFLLCCLLLSSCTYATIVSHDGRAITIDGHRRVLLSGSIHYPRSTSEVINHTSYILIRCNLLIL